MNRISVASLRAHSSWLALLLCAGILVISVSLTVYAGSARGAAALPTAESLSSMAPGFSGPQQCAECHPSEFYDWSGTSHARASFDPIFQEVMHQAQEPGECFACHTTGYNAITGQFIMAGVTCEACHGPYRTDHPGASMRIAASRDLCGACHKNTIAEWQISQHGKAGIACVACHEVHSQKTRAAANTTALCAGCHAQSTQDAMHHTHQNAHMECVQCHLSRPASVGDSAASGNAVTGHTFVADSSNCGECHVAGK